jgi:hypothetical protein
MRVRVRTLARVAQEQLQWHARRLTRSPPSTLPCGGVSVTTCTSCPTPAWPRAKAATCVSMPPTRGRKQSETSTTFTAAQVSGQHGRALHPRVPRT